MKRLLVIALAIVSGLMCGAPVFAQTTIFNETVGTPTATTPINSYTGWSNPGLTFTGTGDVRTSTPSTGYTGASGSGNVFLTNSGTANFQIAGVNTTGYTSLTLSFGVFKSTTASNGSELTVQVSTDGVNYTNLTFPALPTGSGTAVWALRTAAGTIPSTPNLRIRFANTSITPQFRLDDITLTGTVPTTVEFGSANYFEDESQIAFISVRRFGDLSGTTTVDYSTQVQNALGTTATGGASCTSGVDYIHQSGTLTFDIDEDFKEIQIQLCGDLISEADEYFNLYLSNVTNGTLGGISTAQVYINDTANQFVNTEQIFVGTSGDPSDSSIVVTGAPTSIGSMRVTLFDFSHITADDVDVLLVGPQGQKLLLMADAGGDDGLTEGATITFDDTAGQVLPDDLQIFSGKYEPTTWEPGQPNFPAPTPAGPYEEPGSTVGGAVTLASVFGGTNANGTWTLYIRDDNNMFQKLGADGVVDGGWGIQFLAPTAAGVSVSGQVRSGKTPAAGVTLMITGGELTQPLFARTNSFGNYTFEGLTAGQIYVVTVVSKRYTFAQPSIVLNVEDNIAGADFEAEDK